MLSGLDPTLLLGPSKNLPVDNLKSFALSRSAAAEELRGSGNPNA